MSAALHGTLLFHLNLSYSSIDEAEHPELLARCYRPLLGLCDELPWLVLALEATGHTLERIERLDPAWTAQLRALQAAGRVEFVGSGDTQLIGPLVPAAVNRWNQRLGQEDYARLLDHTPKTALVNEMAWSQGIVEHYVDAGYELVLMEWNNPRRNHPEWKNEERYRLSWTESPRGERIALAWVDAVAFQKFQRAVVDDLSIEEYLAWLEGERGDAPRHLFLYASDAEVFDYRPRRFRTEPTLAGEEGEWARMARILRALSEAGVVFTTPERLRQEPAFQPRTTLQLTSAADPVPVKKQPKYNVVRWALTGRDDLGLNARCFARARDLEARKAPARDWRALCRLWASDLRTHLTKRRWEELLEELRSDVPPAAGEDGPGPDLRIATSERQRNVLVVETDDVLVGLDTRRGLAIQSLGWKSLGDVALLGTLPHGYFDSIDWAADFYSGHVVCEVPAKARVTDLERVEPVVERGADRVWVTACIPTPLGALEKSVEIFADRIVIAWGFAAWGERPQCSLRCGFVTLNPEVLGEALTLACAQGGAPERFRVLAPCDHGKSVSTLISAGAAFGATEGRLALDDGARALELSWDLAQAPALPLFTFQRVAEKRFLRVAFSLSEIDETHRAGAPLRDFRLTIRARAV